MMIVLVSVSAPAGTSIVTGPAVTVPPAGPTSPRPSSTAGAAAAVSSLLEDEQAAASINDATAARARFRICQGYRKRTRERRLRGRQACSTRGRPPRYPAPPTSHHDARPVVLDRSETFTASRAR